MLKFLSPRPKDLKQFIRQLEDLWKEARITEDSKKQERALENMQTKIVKKSGACVKHMVLGILGKL